MPQAVLIARLLLVGVFGVAGAAKLRDRPGSLQALLGFGLPELLAGPVAVLLPLTELTVAALLVVPASARWSAGAAAVLATVFALAIAHALRNGRRPDCHCFGRLHSSQAGAATLWRSIVLAAAAVFVAAKGPGTSIRHAWSWLGEDGRVIVLASLAAIAVATQFWLIRQLLLQNGRLLLRIEALEADGLGSRHEHALSEPSPGVVAPPFELRSVTGAPVTLAALLTRGQPLLLTFSSPRCGACDALLPEIGRWQRDHADLATVVLISDGDAESNRRAVDIGISNLLLQEGGDVSRAYGVPGTPAAITVDPTGRVTSRPALGHVAIRSLWRRLIEDRTLPALTAGPATTAGAGATGRRLKLGAQVPVLPGPNALGERLTLLEITRDRFAALYFWDGEDPATDLLADEIDLHKGLFASTLAFVVVVRDPAPHVMDALGRGDRRYLFPVTSGEMLAPFGITELPAGLLLAPGALVDSELYVGHAALTGLLAAALDRSTTAGTDPRQLATQ